MIEPSLRDEHILALSDDDSVAVLLLDLVLGYGAHPDPAAGLSEVIAKVKEAYADRGAYLSVVASITGTAADPQDYLRQREQLEGVGAIVMDSNEQAAQLVHAILSRVAPEGGR